MECLPTLLNPATKMFAGWLLDNNALLVEATALLKTKHLEAYEAWKTSTRVGVEAPLAEELLQPRQLDLDSCLEDDEEDSSTNVDEEFDDPGITLDAGGDMASDSITLVDEANIVFDEWMGKSFQFGNYSFDGAKPLVANRANGKVSFRELVSKFDTMKY